LALLRSSMRAEVILEKLSLTRVMKDLVGSLPPGRELYLVGGALRDLFLGRRSADFDFATPFDPTPLAQSFARRIGGHWFFLDEPRRQSRVVEKGEGITYDFAPYRAEDLKADLRLRDFTVNALALPLHREGEIFDPVGGLADLEAKRLRACSANVFEDDPLRVLKGVRHCISLGFEIEEQTSLLMRASAPRLGSVAPERIRSELGAIFGAEPVASSLDLMRSLGVTDTLFGSLYDLEFRAGADLAVRCEELMERLRAEPEEAGILMEEIEANFSRAALLKMAALGRGCSPEEMSAWGERFKLSRRSSSIVNTLSRIDPALWNEIGSIPPGRPRALWTAELGRHPVEALIFLGVLGGENESNASIVRGALRDFLRYSDNGRVSDLLDGSKVAGILSLPSGPALGKVLAALRREEISGRVTTPEEAISFLTSERKKRV
jgi:poly(A) polymerase